MSNVKIAVIGIGSIARRAHLPGYMHANANIVALCSPNATDLEDIASQYNATPWRDWQAMIRSGGFDAVSICTPPALHCEMSTACSKAGFHVLVEKPMAISLDECDQMIAAADKANKILMVYHNMRNSFQHRQAREILKSGILGKPYLAHAVIGHDGPEEWSPASAWFFQAGMAGLGVLADLAYHKIDLLRYLLDQEIDEICALTSTFEKNTTLEDSASLLMRFNLGTLATLQASWVMRPDWENTLVIHCRYGRLSVPTDQRAPLRIERYELNGERIETTHATNSLDEDGWQQTIAQFVQAVSGNLPSPISGVEGRAALSAVLAASISAQTKRFIPPGRV